ncbi:MAG: gamma-glutamylcyclotransferase family protein [Gemmatimonadaceae bacterium]
MPLLFSYGSLQLESVQLSTFGRRLAGASDELVGFARTTVSIDDPQLVATLGKTHHDNVELTRDREARVAGMVFEVGDAELASVDAYEAAFSYARIDAMLASGRRACLYVHSDTHRG